MLLQHALSVFFSAAMAMLGWMYYQVASIYGYAPLTASLLAVAFIAWFALTIVRWHQVKCVMSAVGAAIIYLSVWWVVSELQQARPAYFDATLGLLGLAMGYSAVAHFFTEEKRTWDDVFPSS